jgi:hypothetical protein
MKGCCSMQRMQNIVLIMFVGVAFAMQASVSAPGDLKECVRESHDILNTVYKSAKPRFNPIEQEVEEMIFDAPKENLPIAVDILQPIKKRVRGKSIRPYDVESYLSDQADITPLVQAVCLKYNHTIENDTLHNLIKGSKILEEQKQRKQSKCVQAQDARYGVSCVYDRIICIFKKSRAQQETLTALKSEKYREADRIFKGIESRTPEGIAYRKERAKTGKAKASMMKFYAKKKQQAPVNNEETANKENNNPQLQQVGQAATYLRQPQLTIKTFTNVYDPIEIHNNVVDDAREFKKSRHSPIEQRVAEILVSDIRVKDFHKQYFPELKMSSNTEIQ